MFVSALHLMFCAQRWYCNG